ncbi:MAG: alpha/beta hydrolase [Bacillota bacterium]|nr:alpha/beta hydrolase [Bacillota bacterium]
MKKKSIIIITLIIIIISSLFIIPHLVTSDMTNNHISFNKTWEPEEFNIEAEKLFLKTEDNIKIMTYEVYEENPKAAVIFISGIQNPSVTYFFGHAEELQKEGYSSFLMEMRAHGESGGDTVSLGFKEYLDTKAVVEYIKNNPKYNDVPIVVFGLSMGGATAINSIGEIPEIDGLISLSAYSSFEDVFHYYMVDMGLPKILADIQKPFVKMYTTFKFGFKSFNASPKQEIKKLNGRPALLMHSLEDSEIPYDNFLRIKNNAPNYIDTLIVEGDKHFIVEEKYALEPEKDKKYWRKILEFLDKNFNN